LLAGSPCIDEGNDFCVPADALDIDEDGDVLERWPVDPDWSARFVDDPDTEDSGVPDPPDYPEVVDMGAYEFVDCNDNDMTDAQDIEGGTSQDCNTNVVPDECESVDVLSVCSLHPHGEAGELCLDLGTYLNENWIEPRMPGVRELVCQMSMSVDPATVSGENVQVACVNSVYEGTIGAWPAEGEYCPDSGLVITFDPALPDLDCCQITFDGITSIYGQPSVAELAVRTLAGDVDLDGEVLTADASKIKSRFQDPVGPGNFLHDVDCDGQIITVDASKVKSRFQNTAPSCP
jgi:hypothetical protein